MGAGAVRLHPGPLGPAGGCVFRKRARIRRKAVWHARRDICGRQAGPKVSQVHTRGGEGVTMAKTFMQMVGEAQAAVPGISAAEAQEVLKCDPNALLIDVRDAADIQADGHIEGAVPISAGMLPVRADTEMPESWRDARLADRSRPVITHCVLGPLGAISAKTLHDMGFTNVRYIEGGIEGWRQAGLPIQDAGMRPAPH